jgi:DNA-binding transcriptional ArsR family regulator
MSMNAFTALADPTRRKILELLSQTGELTATEIYRQFSISSPAISQHLKILREASLVQVEKRAQQRVYRINPETLLKIEGWAHNLSQLWADRFDQLETVLEQEKRSKNEHK